MLTANRALKPQARPAAGVCRWVFPLRRRTSGVLEINAAEYFITVLQDAAGQTRGYRLEKPDGTAYDVDTTGTDWLCDCADATYRRRACKHAKALRAALARSE
jgi:hypothetical protein